VYAASLLGDRWTLLILRELSYGVSRFADMQADLAIPKQALTTRLAALVRAGLISRRPYREAGQRVRWEYEATVKTRELGPALFALMQWGEAQGGLRPALRLLHRGTLGPVRLALVDQGGKEVPASEVVAVLCHTGEEL